MASRYLSGLFGWYMFSIVLGERAAVDPPTKNLRVLCRKRDNWYGLWLQSEFRVRRSGKGWWRSFYCSLREKLYGRLNYELNGATGLLRLYSRFPISRWLYGQVLVYSNTCCCIWASYSLRFTACHRVKGFKGIPDQRKKLVGFRVWWLFC